MNFLIILLSTSFIMSLIMLMLFAFSIMSGSKVTAKTRYIMWIILLIGLVIPFRPLLGNGLITLRNPEPNIVNQSIVYLDNTSQNNENAVEKQNDTIIADNKIDVKDSQTNKLPFSIVNILFAIWIAGALVLFIKYIVEYKRFYTIIKRWGKPVDDISTLEIFEWTKARMGLENKNIGLISCNMITTPMLTGIFKPTILLPEKDIKDDEMELILAHELTHYKHKDIIINLLSIVALCIHWFNPIIYFCFPAILGDGESCCDEAVLKNKDIDYRRFYGEVIISMIQASPQKQIAFSTCFYAKKLNIKRRLFNIMETNKKMKNLSALAVTTILFLTLVSGSVIVFANPKAKNISVEKAQHIAVNHSKLNKDEISYVKISLDNEKDKDVYNIEFINKDIEYDYKIDAKSGNIIENDRDIENYTIADISLDKNNKNLDNKESLSNIQQNSNINSSDNSNSQISKNSNQNKDEKKIDTNSNAVSDNSNLSSKDKNTQTNKKSNNIITKEQAKSIAINNSGLNSSKAKVVKLELNNENGKKEYDVKIKDNNTEYEYEIDANTGEVTSFDKNEEKVNTNSQNSSNSYSSSTDDDKDDKDDIDDDKDSYNENSEEDDD